jgi:hypothetical protein
LGQIVPSTLKRQARAETARPRPTAPRSEGSRPAEDRAAYRRAPGTGSAGPDKKADVGAGIGDVEFVSSCSNFMTFLFYCAIIENVKLFFAVVICIASTMVNLSNSFNILLRIVTIILPVTF